MTVNFDANKLKFETIDASDQDFFTIEYDDPVFAERVGIIGGKIYLWADKFKDGYTMRLWVVGEPEIGLDEQFKNIVMTGEENEPYYLGYIFSSVELNIILYKLIEYILCLIRE